MRSLLVVGSLALAGAFRPVTAADPAAAVDAIFSPFVTVGSPGCAVGVTREGQPALTRAYGSADLEHDIANTPETIFEAGSVSKQFTAAAVVLLANRGKLSLDDDVRKYAPEVPDYGTKISIRQLLHHTSGLRDWGIVAEAAGRPRGTKLYTHADVLDIVSRQRALNFQPGSEYLYTNTGYTLLAIIVERVSGVSLAEFTNQNIFKPLGMGRTGWRDDFRRIVRGRAVAYMRSADRFTTDMPFENAYGHAGLLTTVGDLLIWNGNLASGKVGGRSLIDEMHRKGRVANGTHVAYAAGLVVSTHRGVSEVYHTGATAGYRAFVARYPDQRLSVAVLCNLAQANAALLARQVADIFLPSPKVAPPTSPIRLPPETLAARAGLYRNRRTSEPVHLAVVDGALRTGSGLTLIPVSKSKFRFEGTARFLEFGSGSGTGATLVTDEGDPMALDRVQPANPTTVQLAEYGGEYYSDEAEATYTAIVVGNALVLRQRPSSALDLAPSYTDAFTTPRGWIVRFVRDATGRVTAFSLGLGRVRDLRFARVK